MRNYGIVRLLSGLIFGLGSLTAIVGPVLIVLALGGEQPGQPPYVVMLFGLLICFNGIVIAAGGLMWASSVLREQWKSPATVPRVLDTTVKTKENTSRQSLS